MASEINYSQNEVAKKEIERMELLRLKQLRAKQAQAQQTSDVMNAGFGYTPESRVESPPIPQYPGDAIDRPVLKARKSLQVKAESELGKLNEKYRKKGIVFRAENNDILWSKDYGNTWNPLDPSSYSMNPKSADYMPREVVRDLVDIVPEAVLGIGTYFGEKAGGAVAMKTIPQFQRLFQMLGAGAVGAGANIVGQKALVPKENQDLKDAPLYAGLTNALGTLIFGAGTSDKVVKNWAQNLAEKNPNASKSVLRKVLDKIVTPDRYSGMTAAERAPFIEETIRSRSQGVAPKLLDTIISGGSRLHSRFSNMTAKNKADVLDTYEKNIDDVEHISKEPVIAAEKTAKEIIGDVQANKQIVEKEYKNLRATYGDTPVDIQGVKHIIDSRINELEKVPNKSPADLSHIEELKNFRKDIFSVPTKVKVKKLERTAGLVGNRLRVVEEEKIVPKEMPSEVTIDRLYGIKDKLRNKAAKLTDIGTQKTEATNDLNSLAMKMLAESSTATAESLAKLDTGIAENIAAQNAMAANSARYKDIKSDLVSSEGLYLEDKLVNGMITKEDYLAQKSPLAAKYLDINNKYQKHLDIEKSLKDKFGGLPHDAKTNQETFKKRAYDVITKQTSDSADDPLFRLVREYAPEKTQKYIEDIEKQKAVALVGQIGKGGSKVLDTGYQKEVPQELKNMGRVGSVELGGASPAGAVAVEAVDASKSGGMFEPQDVIAQKEFVRNFPFSLLNINYGVGKLGRDVGRAAKGVEKYTGVNPWRIPYNATAPDFNPWTQVRPLPQNPQDQYPQ